MWCSLCFPFKKWGEEAFLFPVVFVLMIAFHVLPVDAFHTLGVLDPARAAETIYC
ncbi:hypothetical protein HMPREF3208_00544 [Gardnerella vaginalis]|uniref:Uncharacterized protein n=1 Tax=Gardnerella vaginalis TaxID=2702 RepID=A0A133NYT9_GARVA|nr:hypothetical protein HMPREF3208_00544 [Gardnerella vaginalis]